MPQNLLGPLDYASLVLYLLVMVSIGWGFSRRQTSTDNYFVAKKKIPGWAMGLSLFAATLSCFTFIGFPGWTYKQDMQIMLREYMSVVAFTFSGLFIIPVYRAVVKMSVFEYLELRFGYFARFYSSFGMIFGSPIGLGVLLYVLCIALEGLTGLPLAWLILGIGILTLTYTLWGGIEGVVWTEVIQGLMFIGSGLVTLVFLLFFSTEGGAGEILSTAYTGGKLRIADPEFSLTKPVLFVYLWAGIFHFLSNYSSQPHVVQRYLIAPSLREAIKGTWLSIICCLITWATFMSIGALLWAFYQIHPERLGTGIEGDTIFPYFIGRELPSGLAGLILAGLLASGMSGISSGLNSISACLVSDFYDRFANNSDTHRRLLVSKLSVLVLGVLSIGVALLLMYWEGGVVQFALDVISSIFGPIMGGGVLAMFMLGLFSRRTSKRGMYTGIILGFLFAFWAVGTNTENPVGKLTSPYLSALPAYGLHMWLLFGFTNLFVFIVSYLASRVIDPRWMAPMELTVYGHSIMSGSGGDTLPTGEREDSRHNST